MTRDDDFEIDEEALEAALENPDPAKAVHGDGGNLELWDEEFARELEAKQSKGS